MDLNNRGRALVAGLLGCLLVGGGVAAVTPAGAVAKEAAAAVSWKSVWKTEIKPRADKRYYTKKLANDRYYTKKDATSIFESKTAHDSSLLDYYTKAQSDAAYYTKAQSDAAYYTKAQVDSKLALFHNSVAAFAGGDQSVTLGAADQVIRSVSLMPPANGTVLVSSSAYVINTGATSSTSRCSLVTGTGIDFNALQFAVITHPGDTEDIAGTRGFPVTSGSLLTVNLVCDQFAGSSDIRDSSMTAVFAPS